MRKESTVEGRERAGKTMLGAGRGEGGSGVGCNPRLGGNSIAQNASRDGLTGGGGGGQEFLTK